jgi:hypothetical protein
MRNPVRLLRTALELKDRAFDKSLTFRQRENAVNALFCMPEDIALPVWRSALIGQKLPNKELALGHLRRLHTPNSSALHLDVVTANQEAERNWLIYGTPR